MDSSLVNLGMRLRACRRLRFPDDTQKSFALRLPVNKNTLSAMENGKSSVAIGHYLKAAELLGCDSQFENLFKREQYEKKKPKRSLFDD